MNFQDRQLLLRSFDIVCEAHILVLIDGGFAIDGKTENNETALHLAVSTGYPRVVTKLLSKNIIDINAPIMISPSKAMRYCRKVQKKDGWTALQLASWKGRLDIVKILLDHGASIDAVDPDGKTALRIACEDNQLSIVRCLLDRGAQIDSIDEYGRNSLHIVSWKGQIHVLTLLLDKGANIDAVTKDGRTALYIACYYGQLKIVEILLSRGANIEIPDEEGRIALQIAAKKRYLDIMKLLLDHEKQMKNHLLDHPSPPPPPLLLNPLHSENLRTILNDQYNATVDEKINNCVY